MKQVGNTILAKGVNHILAKRDNSAWPKGAKLSGFSILSTKLAYWLYPKIFKKSECYKEHVAIVTLPYYSAKEVGLNMCICF